MAHTSSQPGSPRLLNQVRERVRYKHYSERSLDEAERNPGKMLSDANIISPDCVSLHPGYTC